MSTLPTMVSLTPSELRALLPYLTSREKEEIDRLLRTGNLWSPLPGPQTLAYESLADETFYGGAAGGGKSSLLLGLAATAHQRSIIFRREYPQLEGLIEDSKAIIGQAGKFNENKLIWRGLPDGRQIEFGAVQRDADVTKYQGRPHDFLGFDELPNFSKRQYQFLIGWNRTTIPNQRCRVVGAGNPPTNAEGEWVIERWAPWLDAQHPNPAAPGELRWFAVVAGEDIECEDGTPFTHQGEQIQPKSRTFIPARITDNPLLMETGYAATLQAMPEPLRSQMLYGDFQAGIDDDPWQVIPTEWVRMAQARWRERSRPDLPLTALGVDVARGGKDKTVLAQRYGNWFGELEKHPGTSTPDGPAVARLVMAAQRDGCAILLDIIGVGGAVYDTLQSHAIRSTPVNFAAGSDATDKSGKLGFVNLRAELYWKFREALDPTSGEEIALPPDSELLADLCAPRWKLMARGIQIEAKEDIVKRIGRSTDCGDAVVLAFTPPPPPPATGAIDADIRAVYGPSRRRY